MCVIVFDFDKSVCWSVLKVDFLLYFVQNSVLGRFMFKFSMEFKASEIGY